MNEYLLSIYGKINPNDENPQPPTLSHGQGHITNQRASTIQQTQLGTYIQHGGSGLNPVHPQFSHGHMPNCPRSQAPVWRNEAAMNPVNPRFQMYHQPRAPVAPPVSSRPLFPAYAEPEIPSHLNPIRYQAPVPSSSITIPSTASVQQHSYASLYAGLQTQVAQASSNLQTRPPQVNANITRITNPQVHIPRTDTSLQAATALQQKLALIASIPQAFAPQQMRQNVGQQYAMTPTSVNVSMGIVRSSAGVPVMSTSSSRATSVGVLQSSLLTQNAGQELRLPGLEEEEEEEKSPYANVVIKNFPSLNKDFPSDDEFKKQMSWFIDKKVELLNDNLSLNKTPMVERIQLIDKDTSHVGLPPLETFMDISHPYRRTHFYRTVRPGDLVVGCVNAVGEFCLTVSLLCMDNARALKIHDLRIKAYCKAVDIPKRQEEAPKDEGPTKKQVRFRLPDAPNEDGSKTEEEMENATENSGNMEEGSYFGGRPSLKGYHIKDNIRGVVMGFEESIVTISMMSEDLPTKLQGHVKLGYISEAELPEHYKNTVQFGRKTYNWHMTQPSAFKNPNFSYLSRALGMNERSSLMGKLQSSEFTDENYAENLRKKQLLRLVVQSIAEGIEHTKDGNYGKATVALNRALDVEPDNVDALMARGTLYATTSNYPFAIKDFEFVMKMKEGHSKAQMFLCETLIVYSNNLIECKRVDDATEFLKRVLFLDPMNAEARSLLFHIGAISKPQRQKAALERDSRLRLPYERSRLSESSHRSRSPGYDRVSESRTITLHESHRRSRSTSTQRSGKNKKSKKKQKKRSRSRSRSLSQHSKKSRSSYKQKDVRSSSGDSNSERKSHSKKRKKEKKKLKKKHKKKEKKRKVSKKKKYSSSSSSSSDDSDSESIVSDVSSVKKMIRDPTVSSSIPEKPTEKQVEELPLKEKGPEVVKFSKHITANVLKDRTAKIMKSFTAEFEKDLQGINIGGGVDTVLDTNLQAQIKKSVVSTAIPEVKVGLKVPSIKEQEVPATGLIKAEGDIGQGPSSVVVEGEGVHKENLLTKIEKGPEVRKIAKQITANVLKKRTAKIMESFTAEFEKDLQESNIGGGVDAGLDTSLESVTSTAIPEVKVGLKVSSVKEPEVPAPGLIEGEGDKGQGLSSDVVEGEGLHNANLLAKIENLTGSANLRLDDIKSIVLQQVREGNEKIENSNFNKTESETSLTGESESNLIKSGTTSEVVDYRSGIAVGEGNRMESSSQIRETAEMQHTQADNETESNVKIADENSTKENLEKDSHSPIKEQNIQVQDEKVIGTPVNTEKERIVVKEITEEERLKNAFVLSIDDPNFTSFDAGSSPTLYHKVMQMIHEDFQVPLEEQDIVESREISLFIAERVGKNTNVLVTFRDTETKDRVLKNRFLLVKNRKLQGKPFVSLQDYSGIRQKELFQYAQSVKQRYPEMIRSIYVKLGKVFLKFTEKSLPSGESEAIELTTRDYIDELVAQKLNCTDVVMVQRSHEGQVSSDSGGGGGIQYAGSDLLMGQGQQQETKNVPAEEGTEPKAADSTAVIDENLTVPYLSDDFECSSNDPVVVCVSMLEIYKWSVIMHILTHKAYVPKKEVVGIWRIRQNTKENAVLVQFQSSKGRSLLLTNRKFLTYDLLPRRAHMAQREPRMAHEHANVITFYKFLHSYVRGHLPINPVTGRLQKATSTHSNDSRVSVKFFDGRTLDITSKAQADALLMKEFGVDVNEGAIKDTEEDSRISESTIADLIAASTSDDVEEGNIESEVTMVTENQSIVPKKVVEEEEKEEEAEDDQEESEERRIIAKYNLPPKIIIAFDWGKDAAEASTESMLQQSHLVRSMVMYGNYQVAKEGVSITVCVPFPFQANMAKLDKLDKMLNKKKEKSSQTEHKFAFFQLWKVVQSMAANKPCRGDLRKINFTVPERMPLSVFLKVLHYLQGMHLIDCYADSFVNVFTKSDIVECSWLMQNVEVKSPFIRGLMLLYTREYLGLQMSLFSMCPKGTEYNKSLIQYVEENRCVNLVKEFCDFDFVCQKCNQTQPVKNILERRSVLVQKVFKVDKQYNFNMIHRGSRGNCPKLPKFLPSQETIVTPPVVQPVASGPPSLPLSTIQLKILMKNVQSALSGASVDVPTSKTQVPTTKTQVPTTKTQVQVPRTQVEATKTQVPTTRSQIPSLMSVPAKQDLPTTVPPRLCKFFLTGRCTKGTDCIFSHSQVNPSVPSLLTLSPKKPVGLMKPGLSSENAAVSSGITVPGIKGSPTKQPYRMVISLRIINSSSITGYTHNMTEQSGRIASLIDKGNYSISGGLAHVVIDLPKNIKTVLHGFGTDDSGLMEFSAMDVHKVLSAMASGNLWTANREKQQIYTGLPFSCVLNVLHYLEGFQHIDLYTEELLKTIGSRESEAVHCIFLILKYKLDSFSIRGLVWVYLTSYLGISGSVLLERFLLPALWSTDKREIKTHLAECTKFVSECRIQTLKTDFTNYTFECDICEKSDTIGVVVFKGEQLTPSVCGCGGNFHRFCLRKLLFEGKNCVNCDKAIVLHYDWLHTVQTDIKNVPVSALARTAEIEKQSAGLDTKYLSKDSGLNEMTVPQMDKYFQRLKSEPVAKTQLIFCGVPQWPDENTKETICELITTNLKLGKRPNVMANLIKSCTRMPNAKKRTPDILVTFSELTYREEVFRSGYKLSNMAIHKPIPVKLIPLFQRALQFQLEGKIHRTLCMHEEVYVITQPGKALVAVYTVDKLNSMVTDKNKTAVESSNSKNLSKDEKASSSGVKRIVGGDKSKVESTTADTDGKDGISPTKKQKTQDDGRCTDETEPPAPPSEFPQLARGEAKKTLLLTGLPETSGENTQEQVLELLREKLPSVNCLKGLDVLTTCQRLETAQKPRDVLCVFKALHMCIAVYKGRDSLGDVIVNKILRQSDGHFFDHALKCRDEGKIHSVSVDNMNVFIRCNADDDYVQVETKSEITSLIENPPSKKVLGQQASTSKQQAIAVANTKQAVSSASKQQLVEEEVTSGTVENAPAVLIRKEETAAIVGTDTDAEVPEITPAMEYYLDYIQRIVCEKQFPLIFTGVPQVPVENTTDEIWVLLTEKMGLKAAEVDICSCKRMATRQVDRDILVAFKDRTVWKEIHGNRHMLEKPILINKPLLPGQLLAFKSSLALKKEGKIHDTFVNDNKVYLVVKDGDKPVGVTYLSQIEKVIAAREVIGENPAETGSDATGSNLTGTGNDVNTTAGSAPIEIIQSGVANFLEYRPQMECYMDFLNEEQVNHTNGLIFTGVKEKGGANVTKQVMELIAQSLSIGVRQNHILKCHRLDTEHINRDILVIFKDCGLRERIYDRRASLQSRVLLNKPLFGLAACNLFKHTVNMNKMGKIYCSYVDDDKVYVVLKKGANPVCVNSIAHVDELVQEVVVLL